MHQDGGPVADVWHDGNGLWSMLAMQLQAFMDHSGGLVCHWSMDIMPGLPAPRGVFASAVAHIFHEMLSNVARHAQASDVNIRVRATLSDITLLVKDNGRGAPPSTFERHDAYGIMSMRERAIAHGGWLQIDSHPGSGTQLILSMPMRGTAALLSFLRSPHEP